MLINEKQMINYKAKSVFQSLVKLLKCDIYKNARKPILANIDAYNIKANTRCIVEFIAPPGSGKSTIILSLVKEFCGQKPSFSVDPSVSYDLTSLEMFAISNFVSQSIKAKENYSFILTKINQYYQFVHEDKLLRRIQGVHICDETGFFRKLHRSLHPALKTDPLIKEWLHDFLDGHTRVIFWLNINPEQIADRICKRHKEQGRLWSGHVGKSRSELVQIAKNQLEYYAKYLALLDTVTAGRIRIKEITKMADAAPVV
jgi:hypothetical protein